MIAAAGCKIYARITARSKGPIIDLKYISRATIIPTKVRPTMSLVPEFQTGEGGVEVVSLM
jgi:hypothetical protein